MLCLVLLALSFGICASAGDQNKTKGKLQSLSRGLGSNINWVKSYEEALLKMVSSQKPLMVIHHREDCTHSQDPTMTVCADIAGKYNNRRYTYMPGDMALYDKNRERIESYRTRTAK